MRTHLSIAAASVVATLALACAPPGGGDGGSDTDPSVRAVTADVLPRFTVDEQVSLCLDVAVAAAQLTGTTVPVTHGTVDTTGESTTYDDAPADALVLVQKDATTRYQVTRADYDTSVATIHEAFLRDHDVACRAVRAGAFDLTLSSRIAGGASTRHADGSVRDGGDSYGVTLDETGTDTTRFDQGSVQYDGSAERTLTVTGDGLDITAHETDTNVVVIVDNAAENRNTALTLEGEVDGASFSLDDGLIRRSFLDGVPEEPDFWGQTHGTLTRGGDDAGTLAFKPTDSAFEIVLSQDTGDSVLEAWSF